jgi:hypothetical protein
MKTIKSLLLVICFLSAFSVAAYAGDAWAYLSKSTPDEYENDAPAFINAGTYVSYTLSVTTFYIQGPWIDCIAGLYGGGTFDQIEQYTNSGPYQQVTKSRTGNYTSNGNTTICYALIEIPQGFVGSGQASSYISW